MHDPPTHITRYVGLSNRKLNQGPQKLFPYQAIAEEAVSGRKSIEGTYPQLRSIPGD